MMIRTVHVVDFLVCRLVGFEIVLADMCKLKKRKFDRSHVICLPVSVYKFTILISNAET